MKIDPGMAVVILAVSVFYLRLIYIQWKRSRRATQPPAGKRIKNAKMPPQKSLESVSILSHNRLGLAIAGAGVLAIGTGIGLYARWLDFPALQPYWWLPTAAGITAFNWAFK